MRCSRASALRLVFRPIVTLRRYQNCDYSYEQAVQKCTTFTYESPFPLCIFVTRLALPSLYFCNTLPGTRSKWRQRTMR